MLARQGVPCEPFDRRKHMGYRVHDASVADGIILATARKAGPRLVSSDPAFRGQPDVSAR